MRNSTKLLYAIVATASMALSACSDDNNDGPEMPSATGNGLFIINQGNFSYGNSTLSFYDPAENEVENNVFFNANGMKLGDVAQSMTIYGNKAWVVVNGSSVIYAINPDSFVEEGRITNIGSPRYIHFINDSKAYVTQINDNNIYIVNPRTYSVTGYITVPGMNKETGSTEQVVQRGKYAYVNCWSYQRSIIKIDTDTDEVVDVLNVGIQPESIVIDREGDLWALCDGGGWEGNPAGFENASLWRIDTDDMEVEDKFTFAAGTSPSKLCINGKGNQIYWLNGSVWSMDIKSKTLPVQPLINSDSWFYALTVNPVNGEIYTADAIDYMQNGMIYRYSAIGELIDSFYAGVIPGGFCWK